MASRQAYWGGLGRPATPGQPPAVTGEGQDDLRRLARHQQSTGEGWVDLPATPGLTPASGLRYTERGGRRPAAYSYRQRGQCRPRHTDSRFLHWGGWRWKFLACMSVKAGLNDAPRVSSLS